MSLNNMRNIICTFFIWTTPFVQCHIQAQDDNLSTINLDDTIQVRKYIEKNASTDEIEFQWWRRLAKRARFSLHEWAQYYCDKEISSMPASTSPVEKVEVYTRYSVYMTNQYILDVSLLYAYKAEDIAENANDDYMRAKVKHALGWYYAANCDYGRAHRTYDESIELFKSANYLRGVRNTMVKKAVASQLEGNNKEALRIYNEVYNLKDRTPTLNDRSLLIKSTFKNKDTARTKILLKEYFENISPKDTSSHQFYNLKSIEAAANKNDDLQLHYLSKAESNARFRNHPKEHFSMLMGLGKFYFYKNELEKAKEHFSRASTLANNKLMHNRFDEPNEYLIKIATVEGDKAKLEEYISLKENYAKVTKQKISVNNTIENNQKSILVRQRKEIQSQNQKIWILTALGFMGMGLLLFSFFYFRRYKKIVEDLSNKNNLLDVAVNEKQTLLQETHHRVKNNLQIIASLLNLQRKYSKDKKLTTALVDGRNRVKSMALIHQLLYQKKDLKGINVRNYVENLMSSLFSSLKADAENIVFTNEVEPLNLHEDTLLSIGLIINEIVTNSLKYAFPNNDGGEINIVLTKKGDQLLLSISDNGKGIPEDFDINDKSSFGYSLVTSLSKKLDAAINIFNQDGTTVDLVINKFIEV